MNKIYNGDAIANQLFLAIIQTLHSLYAWRKTRAIHTKTYMYVCMYA